MKANVNIWSIEKDSSIKLFLLLLEEKFALNSLCISENVNLDCRSVRIYKKNDHQNSAYIYTYGQQDGKYGVHLEFPIHDDTDVLSSLDVYEGISFDKTAELLSTHFDLV